ncbi:anti-anti-sigma factor [Dyella solisilvae]|uniref:Anti-anti-sigma factor n=1 Tax=Dyella solisilvae TaxID=1920168 RepID=A0A370K355_9GAMM|nr:sigma-E factor negative regulatory protein [Dyella solisilvae]RDI97096.1 anti-anti-sigma factor [Dyella solisilvae]
MTDNQRENLSAGMDGALSKEELRFLLRRLDHDESLQQAWSRYHVARDGLRRQLPPLASGGFADRVMRAIEQDVVVVQGKRRHWLHWSAGGAIAASVAVAALMIAQPAGSGADRAAPLTAAVSSEPASVEHGNLMARAETPAVAPPWVNAYADSPYKLTQQASATFEGEGHNTLLYSRNSLSPYRVARYPAVSNGDGSYLLLIHPDQQQPALQAPENAQ